MSLVFDDFDPTCRAFGYTFFLFLVSGLLSMVLGTILVAMRVGPIAVLRKAACDLRHHRAQHAARHRVRDVLVRRSCPGDQLRVA